MTDGGHTIELRPLRVEDRDEAVNERLVAMFTRAGFVQEALLKDHVRETAGTSADLLVLSRFVDEATSDPSPDAGTSD